MGPSASGIQGQFLEVTVAGCNNLLDTEWISKQDPYVCIEYANTKFRTRTCTDGHKNPTFQEKFIIPLVEGLHELNVLVWNSNTITYDDLIGSGRVQLHKVLIQGFDDTPWPLQSKNGRHAGVLRLIMHYDNASGKTAESATLSAPAAPHVLPYTVPASPHVPHALPVAPHVAPYAMPPAAAPFAPPTTYPAASPYPSYPTHPTSYPAPPTAYNPHQYSHQASYPPPPHAAPHYPAAGTYPGAYPPPY